MCIRDRPTLASRQIAAKGQDVKWVVLKQVTQYSQGFCHRRAQRIRKFTWTASGDYFVKKIRFAGCPRHASGLAACSWMKCIDKKSQCCLPEIRLIQEQVEAKALYCRHDSVVMIARFPFAAIASLTSPKIEVRPQAIPRCIGI